MTRRFRLGRRGVASIEFAISVPVVLIMVGWMYDLSNVLIARIQLSNAVQSAAYYAALAGPSVTATTLTSIVQKSGTIAATASITGPACYCVTSSPTALTAATCGASCSGGSTAVNYVLITGNYTYTPLLPDLSGLTSQALTETATVRLQ
jgi:Flp pilus assembly protein TadG